MGSDFTLRCYPQNHLSQKDCLNLFKEAEQEIIRIENELTEFRESPFNNINESAGIRSVKVSDEILFLIEYAQNLARETNGLFDISSSSLIYHHKKALKEGKQLSTDEQKYYEGYVDYKKIEIDPENKTVFLPFRDMRIGFGGIGKGYAVDRIYELLKSKGMINFYINGSGDIRVHSHQNAPRKWRIGLQNPMNPENYIGLIQLSDGALATSGTYKQKGHLFNKSSSELISVTILCDTCIESDTLGTILINMCEDEAISFLNKKNLAGIVINKKGLSLLSKRALDLFGK